MTHVHIHAPAGKYLGQVRLYGHQKWDTVTMKCRTAEQAMAAAVMFMTANHHRARVLFVTDDGWYEPSIAMECKR
jgi:3-dehydroquinate dehydratase